MTDIVEKLRTDVHWHMRRQNWTIAADCKEAADEIERLRADLAVSMETAHKAQKMAVQLLNERAAIAAPPGWVLVPAEPTEAMIDATYHGQPLDDIWRDMVAAAPDAQKG